MRLRGWLCAVMSLLGLLTWQPELKAQQYPHRDGRYFPLNTLTPPSAAQWAVQAGRLDPNFLQPVRVDLSDEGLVTVYEGRGDVSQNLASGSTFAIQVARSYRLKISGLKSFPGQDFYPTIELIDRLHPPQDKAFEFPIPIVITDEDIELSNQGLLVTKVIYLEQPDRIPVGDLDKDVREHTAPPNRNVLAEADYLGRPVAILRLGGRTPDLYQPDPTFYGPGGPVLLPAAGVPTGVPHANRTPTRRTFAQQTSSRSMPSAR